MISIEAFRDFTEDNDTLSQYLRRPSLNLASMDTLLTRVKELRDKKYDINKVRNKINVKPSAAVKIWAEPDVITQYGAYVVTYTLMAKRYIAATEASKDKLRAKYDSQTYEEKERRRLYINAQVRERKRGYAAAKMASEQAATKRMKTVKHMMKNHDHSIRIQVPSSCPNVVLTHL